MSIRHGLMLETLDERGPLSPHACAAGDDELGRCSWFRQELRARHEPYVLKCAFADQNDKTHRARAASQQVYSLRAAHGRGRRRSTQPGSLTLPQGVTDDQ